MQPSAVESVFRATLLPQEVKRHIYFIYLAYACYGGAVVVNLNRGIVGPIASAAMATHPVARAAAAQAPKEGDDKWVRPTMGSLYSILRTKYLNLLEFFYNGWKSTMVLPGTFIFYLLTI
jgi:hypothetical protein